MDTQSTDSDIKSPVQKVESKHDSPAEKKERYTSQQDSNAFSKKASDPESTASSGGFSREDSKTEGDYQRVKRRFAYRKKECYFKKNKITYIDFKDVTLLSRFIGKSGRITPPRFTGTSKNYQRKLAKAIKRARYMALLPYVDNR